MSESRHFSFTNHSLTFYSFAVHALVVSVIVHYLSHAKNFDWLIDWLIDQKPLSGFLCDEMQLRNYSFTYTVSKLFVEMWLNKSQE